jgi:cell wall-associated NlpC family hydrolase
VTDSNRARHRAACRPLTPLDDFAAAAANGMASVGRRSAAVAMTGGLAITTMSIPAAAAPAEGPANALPPVDVTALTEQARAALATSPVVQVPTDVAEWTFDAPEFTVTANPKPEPVRATSRSNAAARGEARAVNNAVPAAVAGNAVLEIAARYVGVPYVSGGSTPDGFDCSGFVSYVYGQLGISLPRSSGAYYDVGTRVSEPQPGDIIVSPGHVGIYAGDGLQIDAPRPGKTIQFRGIWQSNPVFVRVTG